MLQMQIYRIRLNSFIVAVLRVICHFDGRTYFTFKEEPIVSAIAFESNTVISDKELEKLVENIGLTRSTFGSNEIKGKYFLFHNIINKKGI